MDINKTSAIGTYKNKHQAAKYKFHQINQSKINFMAHSKWVYKRFSSHKETKNLSLSYIKYSIDINKFKPKNRLTIRKKLKIPKNVFVIMTSAVGMLSNPFKDFSTLCNAYIKILNKQEQFLLIVVGDKKTNFKSTLYSEKFLFVNPIPQSMS